MRLIKNCFKKRDAVYAQPASSEANVYEEEARRCFIEQAVFLAHGEEPYDAEEELASLRRSMLVGKAYLGSVVSELKLKRVEKRVEKYYEAEIVD